MHFFPNTIFKSETSQIENKMSNMSKSSYDKTIKTNLQQLTIAVVSQSFKRTHCLGCTDADQLLNIKCIRDLAAYGNILK